jgi:hypothetical protein
MSAIKKVEFGVPLGSVFWAQTCVFCIYVTDIVMAAQHAKVNLFADDILLSVVGDSVEECLVKINEDLDRLAE